MRQYAIRRALFFLPVIFAVTVITFVATNIIPGDPAVAFLGFNARPEEIKAFEHSNNLDKPAVERYFDWLGGMLTGDPGRSLRGSTSIRQEFQDRLPVTLAIGLCTALFITLFGLSFGIIAAVWQDSPIDYFVRLFSVIGQSIPEFFSLTLLVLLPAIWWRYAPPFGYVPFWEDPVRGFKQIIPPTLVLSIGGSAVLMRITRAALLEALRQDYVRTARAKGLTARLVLFRHAIKNALVPILTIVGTLIGAVLGGAAILENITALPGLGAYTLGAVSNRDTNVIMTMVAYFAIIIVIVDLSVDLLYAIVDPRIRYR